MESSAGRTNSSPVPARSGPERVREALSKHGIAAVVQELPESTRTAPDAAAAVGCPVAEIAKSLVFRGRDSGRPVLAVVSGANRVDLDKLGALAGEALGKADADFVRGETGYAIGGVPPLGFASPIPTFLDEDLFRHDGVWAAAGSPFALFRVAPETLRAATAGRRADLKEREKRRP